jgi:hypothetical protein
MQTPRSNVAAALALRNLSEAEVFAEVENVYGDVEAIVATGSLADGLGNRSSDLDLQVIVDRDDISGMPLPSFAKGVLVHVEYHAAAKLRKTSEVVVGRAWPYDEVSPAVYLSHRRNIVKLSRFATGCVLRGREPWIQWQSDLSCHRLPDRIVEWHAAEAVRGTIMGDWVFREKSALGCQRYLDAFIAWCELQVAADGDLYQGFDSKWILRRLRRQEKEEQYRLLRELLAVPAAGGALAEYGRRLRPLLEGVLAHRDITNRLEIQVWLDPDVKAYYLGKKTVLSKYGLRAVEVPDTRTFRYEAGNCPIALLKIGDSPPDELRTLFADGWLWITMAARRLP